MGAAFLWCFAARRSVRAMAICPCQALQRRCGTPQERPKGWFVSPMAAFRLLQRTMAIRFEAGLALNTDRPTELINTTLREH